jgi:hypothetical protein
MISVNGLEYIKDMCETQANMVPGGIMYIITDGDVVSWRKTSNDLDFDIFSIGEKLNPDSVASKAIRDNKKVVANISRYIYGIELLCMAEPIVDNEGQAVGAFTTLYPIEHPVIKAFKAFAPVLSEMYAEGVMMYTTDLKKFIDVQNSQKFQLSVVKAGAEIRENSPPITVINTKKMFTKEYDASAYGQPVFTAINPLFDEYSGEVVGTFGIIIPKTTAVTIREMSHNLEVNLEGISSTISELAASASNIHENEQNLNNSINEIITLSKEINEVSSFIKEIADETKMLGLNAAIEAARAGDVGRGFGVVADEIRKLSEQSKSTVPKIQKLTDRIIEKVNHSSVISQNSLASSQDQAASTEEITASVEEITAMSEKLSVIALKL